MDWSSLPLDEMRSEVVAFLQSALTELGADVALFKSDILDLGESMLLYGTKAALGDAEAKEIFHLVQHRGGLLYARIFGHESDLASAKWEQALDTGMKIIAAIIKALLK